MNPAFHQGLGGPNPSRRRHLKASGSVSSGTGPFARAVGGGTGSGLILPTSLSNRPPPSSQPGPSNPLAKKRNWTPSYHVLPPELNGNFAVGSGSGSGSAASSGFHQVAGTSSGSATGAAFHGLPTTVVPLPSSHNNADHAQQQQMQGLGESTYASVHATFSATHPGTALDSAARLQQQQQHHQQQQQQQSQNSFPQEEEHTDGPAPKRRKGVAGAIIDTALNAAIGTLAAGLTAWTLYSSWGQRAENAAREELMRNERSSSGQGRAEGGVEGEEERRRGRGGEQLQSPVVAPHEEPPPPYHDDLSLSTPTSPGGGGGGSASGAFRSNARQTPVYISGHRRRTRPNYRSHRSMRIGAMAGDGGSNSGASTPNRPGMFSQRSSFSQAAGSSSMQEYMAASVPAAPIEPITAVEGDGEDDDDDAFLRVNTNLASLIAEGQAALNAPVVGDDMDEEDDEDEHLGALMNPAMHTPLHATTLSPRGGLGRFQGGGQGMGPPSAPAFDFNFGARSNITPARAGGSSSTSLGTAFQTPPSSSPFVFSGGAGGAMTTPPRNYRTSALPRPSPGPSASPYARNSTGVPARSAVSGSASASGGLLMQRRAGAGVVGGRGSGGIGASTTTPRSGSRVAVGGSGGKGLIGSGGGPRQMTSPDVYGSDVGRRERPRWG
ncbi:hypothetical protein CF327_g5448 [Tilletia walkeri]|nr:hypothetical protein CF327_g5448 [Tilletia walkeri]